MAVGAAIAGVVVGIAGLAQNNKQSRLAKGQAKERKRMAEAKNARARTKTLSRARVLRAQAIAQGVNQGVGGGSSVQGAASSVQGQGFGEASFSLGQQQSNNRIYGAQQKINKSRGQQQMLQSGLNVVNSFYKPK